MWASPRRVYDTSRTDTGTPSSGWEMVYECDTNPTQPSGYNPPHTPDLSFLEVLESKAAITRLARRAAYKSLLTLRRFTVKFNQQTPFARTALPKYHRKGY